MKSDLVKVGEHVVNLTAIASAHWERETLWVHLVGGRFLSFRGEDGQLLWRVIQQGVVDLRTGELAQ
jgi:hypothetical protein